MKLFDYLERRADRRDERFVRLLDAGRPVSILDRLPGWPSQQFIIALTIVGLFGTAYAVNPQEEVLKGALIAAFAGAWGYFLGSSDSGKRAAEAGDRAVQVAHEAVRALPASATTDVTLQPGEVARVGAEPAGDEA